MIKSLSIITINKNNAQGLNRTILSIAEQTVNDFEYIIIDGASTDESVEVIKMHAGKIDFWVSEPDNGIYNAMNKGIRKSNGKFLLFLNSGDWLADNTVIEKVIPFLNIDFDIISGELYLKNEKEIIKLLPPQNVNLNYCIEHGLTHPNTFIKRDLFDQFGYYNETNKIISDWEFFLIVCGLNRCKYEGIQVPISYFTMDGISAKNQTWAHEETKVALKRLLPWWKKLERLLRGK